MNTLQLITRLVYNLHEHTDADDVQIARALQDSLAPQFGYTTACNMINAAFVDERKKRATAYHEGGE